MLAFRLKQALRPLAHLLLYGLLMSCVTPYQPETKSLPNRSLIVDGYITDQLGPHQVTLTYTADYTNTAVNFIVSGATVYVTDDQGNRQSFSDLGRGVYRTPATFKGQPGRTYKLTVILPDGRRYESQPETIRPVPAIDNIYATYTQKSVGNTATFDKGFDVYLDTTDPATTGDYYRWVWTHYEFLDFCEVRSRFVGSTAVENSYSCCQKCWDIIRCTGANCNNAISDEAINGKAISGQFIMRAPFSSLTSYYLEIEQLSISRDAYIYYKSIENLTQNNGGIFDAAPSSLRGNMVSVSDPGETVFGYFSASGAQKVPYRVDRTKGEGTPNLIIQPPLPPSPPPPPCAECVESDYRTRIQPRWWDL
ncbi:DUF4249 domain-containing protein [Fibrella aestuarina]|nr:DUF4249 domain-containing protein [Fibrella aestuarina]